MYSTLYTLLKKNSAEIVAIIRLLYMYLKLKSICQTFNYTVIIKSTRQMEQGGWICDQ